MPSLPAVLRSGKKAEASGRTSSPLEPPNFRGRSDWCDDVIDKQDRGPIAFLAARACEPSANFGFLDDPIAWTLDDWRAKWAPPSIDSGALGEAPGTKKKSIQI
ncbi:uncharacterized protein N7496_007218 [Penicillium cataractarum]|uniref:Uncharacterized protein n=1 Tax=Penicillium cataractarum TaxID=2100454 RepID=A0A9W9V9D7_9EURO|nr:uncharacterized protein N7496_007218 [Penicillium cataractarum]KAJ5371126.1 hypothetical protein N7496_007218 [Penicillium cataractarum]